MPKPPPGFEWDEAKAAANWRKHGVSFADAARFDFVSALELEGVNGEFEEVRFVKLGKVGRVLHVIVYTQRQEKIRIISFRKATAAERRFYIAVKGY